MTSNGAHVEAVVDFHLFGEVDYYRCVQLQRRLVYEAATSARVRVAVLLCEHPPLITVGRSGSRSHIHCSGETLEREGVRVRWVNRSGGCIVHGPGQLAIYPIVPLGRMNWSTKAFLKGFRDSIRAALDQQQVRTVVRPGAPGIWGKTGLLAAMGISIQDGVSYHGMFLNVNPAPRSIAWADTATGRAVPAGRKRAMSCLLAERRQPVRMSRVRIAVVEALAAFLPCPRHNVHSGHPWLLPDPPTGGHQVRRAC